MGIDVCIVAYGVCGMDRDFHSGSVGGTGEANTNCLYFLCSPLFDWIMDIHLSSLSPADPSVFSIGVNFIPDTIQGLRKWLGGRSPLT